MANKTRGAILYTRVSTQGQAEHGTSLESQIDACRSKAGELGLPIVAEYQDAGKSGAYIAQRDGLQQSVADIKAGRADTLICYSMSRFSRDVADQQTLLKGITASGGRVVFCDLPVEATPAGDMMLTFIGGYAQYERAEFKKRVYLGHQTQAAKGIQTARRRPPYGYHIPTKSDVLKGLYPHDLIGRYVVIEDRAARVRWLFESYAAGTHTLNGLAKQLNREKVPTPAGGKMWCNQNIRGILKNETYKGMAAFGKYDHAVDMSRIGEKSESTGKRLTTARVWSRADPDTWIVIPCPALVSEDLWDRVQARLSENRAAKSGRLTLVRTLSGHVRCRECESSMACMSPTTYTSRVTGETRVTPSRYRCGRNFKTTQSGARECVPIGYFVHKAESAVVRIVAEAGQQADALRAAAFAFAEAHAETLPAQDVRQELLAVDRALTRMKEREAATVQAQIAGIRAGASPDVYHEAFAQIAAERKDLEDRRGVLQRHLKSDREAPSTARGLTAESVLAEVTRVLTSPLIPDHQKRDILGAVVERVYPVKDAQGEDSAEVVFLPGLFAEPTRLLRV